MPEIPRLIEKFAQKGPWTAQFESWRQKRSEMMKPRTTETKKPRTTETK